MIKRSIFASLLLSSMHTALAADLNILYVYTESAAARVANDPTIEIVVGGDSPVDHAQTINSGLNTVFVNSGLGSVATPSITSVAVLDDANYSEASGSNDMGEIAGDFNDAAVAIDVGSTNIEGLAAAEMADLIVVVTDGISGKGAVEEILTNSAGDFNNRTVVVDVDELDGTTLAHEVGHLAGVRHSSDSTTTINQNSARSYRAPNGSYATVTTSINDCNPATSNCELLKVYSKSSGSFGGRSPIGSSTQNASATMQSSLGLLTGYAEAKANATGGSSSSLLPGPSIFLAFMYCGEPNGTAQWDFSSFSPIISDQLYIEQSWNNGATWSQIYQGTQTELICPGDSLRLRVRYRDEIDGELSGYTYRTVYRNCPGGDPGDHPNL